MDLAKQGDGLDKREMNLAKRGWMWLRLGESG
jgi:hypothetical protein